MSEQSTSVQSESTESATSESTPKRRGRKAETKFVPCVARHFTGKVIAFGKSVEEKLGTISEGLTEYEGMSGDIAEAYAEVQAAMAPLQAANLKLARILNARSSKPVEDL